jgi:hypothetical protein
MPDWGHSARLKLARAKEHVAELKSKWEAYKAGSNFAAVAEKNAAGTLDYRVKVRTPIPAEWSLVLGDAIHNLRAVLDHLAWSAVERNSQVPGKQTCFPISKDRPSFPGTMKDALRGASDRARVLVHRLRPYGGGNEKIWRLHQLDIADKHRLILAVGASYRSANLRFTAVFPDGNRHALGLPLVPADRMFPLKDGDVLFSNVPIPVEPPAGEMGVVFDLAGFTLDLAFGHGQVADGDPVIETLGAYVNHVERIADLFDRLVF